MPRSDIGITGAQWVLPPSYFPSTRQPEYDSFDRKCINRLLTSFGSIGDLAGLRTAIHGSAACQPAAPVPQLTCDKCLENAVETIWDWLTVFLFAGLATLLLQRSSEEQPRDKLWHYAPPALTCAVANYLGNHRQPIVAGLLLLGVVTYVFLVLKVRLQRR